MVSHDVQSEFRNESGLGRRPVVITGASRGIGRSLAEAFAGAGYPLVLLARTEAMLGELRSHLAATAPDVWVHTGVVDVTDYAVVAATAHITRAAIADAGLPPIGTIINNAGVVDSHLRPIWEEDPAEFARVQAVNVLGPFHVIRAFLPTLVDGSGCRVIDLNSGAGVRSAEHHSAYHASKSALFRLGGAVAAAGADRGVYAFEVAPGVVQTDMTRSMADQSNRPDWTPPELVCDLALAIVAGRLDAWSGRMIRAGVDTVESLTAAAAAGLADGARDLLLAPYGPADPLR